MKISILLILFISLSLNLFSQSREKDTKLKSVNYYLKRTTLSRSFIAKYIKLTSNANSYSKKDSLLANKLIKELLMYDETTFYRIMRTRLEWEFKEHLTVPQLDSVKSLLKNSIDSSNYYYMLGIYYRDSLNAKFARQMGYVKVNNQGTEVVNWKTVNRLDWRHPKLLETTSHYEYPIFKDENLKDSSLKYYKMSIELNPKEFYYLNEFLIYLYKLGEETEIQQIINSKLKNYSDKEKVWLKKSLDESYKRQ